MVFFRQYEDESNYHEISEDEVKRKLQPNYSIDVVAWMKENPGMQTLHTVSAWYWWDK